MIFRFLLLAVILSYITWFVSKKVFKNDFNFAQIMLIVLAIMSLIVSVLLGLSALVGS